MLEGLPEEAKASAVGGLVLLAMGLLRSIGLRASKDLISVKSDAVDLSALSRLQERVEKMDKRIECLESSRNRLFGFITRAMGYVARCQCSSDHASVEREILEKEYLELLKESAK